MLWAPCSPGNTLLEAVFTCYSVGLGIVSTGHDALFLVCEIMQKHEVYGAGVASIGDTENEGKLKRVGCVARLVQCQRWLDGIRVL